MFEPESPWHFDYRSVILDEIALEGLSGIGLQMLWLRLEHRLKMPLNHRMKEIFWRSLPTFGQRVELYVQPCAMEFIPIIDRFNITDEMGNIVEPSEPPEGPYTYAPAPDVFGSCPSYNDRTILPHDDISTLSLDDVEQKYGNNLAIVASEDVRWRTLCPQMNRDMWDLTKQQNYCLLELIGKSRENGVMTSGVTNMHFIYKSSLSYYARVNLQSLGLIRSVCIGHKTERSAGRGILMTLPRFTKPKLALLPKRGVFHTILEHLKTTTDSSENFSWLLKELKVNRKLLKNLLKRQDLKEIIKVTYGPSRRNPHGSAPERVHLVDNDEPDSELEDPEESQPPLESRYRVGVELVRQAYSRIVEAGHTGLTLLELGDRINVHYISARALMRSLERQKIVRRVMVDFGKTRVARYIALETETATPAPASSTEYAAAKQTLLDYIQHTPQPNVAAKKDPLSEGAGTSDWQSIWRSEGAITELFHIDGMENQISFSQSFKLSSAKMPSLRQLINANAVIKIVREKLVIFGTHNLNLEVQKETKLEQMDAKTVKRLLQRLMLDKQLRMYNIKWPSKSQVTTVIAAPQVDADHSVIRAKWNDICLRAFTKTVKTEAENQIERSANDNLLNRRYTFPKYTRARKLHEFIFDFAYGEKSQPEADLPRGVINLVNIIPEMTVELALGHMNTRDLQVLALAQQGHLMQLKIKQVPPETCELLLRNSAVVLSVKRNLIVLANMGLVQTCGESSSLSFSISNYNALYYINRRSKLINTAGTWPRGGDHAVTEYEFDSVEVVSRYWEDLYKIASVTNVTHNVRYKHRRTPVPPPPKVIKPEEAEALDDGSVPGDGLGAGGLNSLMYVHVGRSWSVSSVKVGHSIQGLKRKLVDIQKFKPSFIPRKRIRLVKKPKEVDLLQKDPMVKKHRSPRKRLAMAIGQSGAAASNPSLLKMSMATGPLVRRRRKILSNSTWTPLEDKIIVWTRIAKAIMAPTPIVGALQIANFVARDLISHLVGPKPTVVVNSRANSIVSEPVVVNMREKLMFRLKCNAAVMERYSGLLRKLRLRNLTNLVKYHQEGMLRMGELVWSIAHLPEHTSFDQSFPPVARTVHELLERFHLRGEASEQTTPTSLHHIRLLTIKLGIVQCMNSNHGAPPSMESIMRSYEVFKGHAEAELTALLDQLKREKIIVAKKGISMQTQLAAEERVAYSSTYKISHNYLLSWRIIYNKEFLKEIVTQLMNLRPTDDVDCRPETVCLLNELSCLGEVEFFLTKKPVVKTLGGLQEPDPALMDVDERVSMKMFRGRVGWRLTNDLVNRPVELYDGIAMSNEVACMKSKSEVLPPSQFTTDPMETVIVKQLRVKKEMGATYNELLESLRIPAEILQDLLKRLEVTRQIVRVGATDNRVVLYEFAEPWLIQLDRKRMRPTPWITMLGALKTECFIGWCGAIVQKVMDHPGCSIKRLADLCRFVTPRNVDDMCRFLAVNGCVHTRRIVVPEYSLFSDDNQEIRMEESCDYLDYDEVLVFPACDILLRYALLRDKVEEYQKDRRTEAAHNVKVEVRTDDSMGEVRIDAENVRTEATDDNDVEMEETR